MSAEKPKYKIKLVLLGDSSVGKTAIIGRFTSNKFQEQTKPTCVCEYLIAMLAFVLTDTVLSMFSYVNHIKYSSVSYEQC